VKGDVRLQFGRHIRTLRKEQGLTQEELARRSRVSIKYLQALEGKKPYSATIVTLKKLADGFDMPLWKMLKFED
jgi:transcriptional regulator with XRE-family HTH domain